MKRLAFLFPVLVLFASQCFADTTAGKPSGVELTVYNQNFALVKEERDITLTEGINFVAVPDVAATIEANSVAFKSLTDPNSVVVREQNYRYDLIEPNTILNKSVGKKIKIRKFVAGQVQEIEGILLNPATVTQQEDPSGGLTTMYNGLVVQTPTGVVMFPNREDLGSVEVEQLPDGLLSRPTLVWKLQSDKAGTNHAQISYIADSITWKSDYVAVIDAFDKYVDLTGWVTLTNNTGATFENASLNLMAGDVNRIQPPRAVFGMMGGMGGAMEKAAEPQFAEKSFFEYHLYTLKDKTTVQNKETKQITLMTAAHIPARKMYVYDGRKSFWMQYMNSDYRPGESYDSNYDKKVAVYMEIVNSKENNLGIPLPKGTVKMYKQETNANQHFVGEDSIDHTPKDEKIRLLMGNAFDIVGEQARTNFRRISDHEVEESFEIKVRNHKDTPVNVMVVNHHFGSWKIVQTSHQYTKKDASTVQFPVDVPKDGEVKIEYTVRTSW